MTSLLQTLLDEFREKLKDCAKGVPREVKFPDIPSKIMVAVGMRRTGKTYFLFQNIHALLAHVPLTQILYLNFEDDRLSPCTQEQLRELIEGFYSLYPENHDQLCYLFFDEIQNVDNWHLVIRRVFDTKKVRIFLTGSSAKLLSKEIATSLRGRALSTEIWPFSFLEYLTARKLEVSGIEGSKRYQDKITSLVRKYLEEGGFPDAILHESPDRKDILQDYVSVVLFRDIVERYHITNISLVRYMIRTLLKTVGCSLSAHKLYNDLKSQSLAVGKSTIHDYLEHIEDAYLAFRVPLYSESLRKSETNPRKVYAVDTGLVNAYIYGFSQNIGHQFENMIYLDLRRHGHEIYYYLTQNRKEVDFYTRDRLGQYHLYQVCWSLEDAQTLERENVALHEAEKELGISGMIVTPNTYMEFLKRIIEPKSK